MLIGLHGYAGSGKDTAYAFIKELLPDRNVIRDAFADRLKLSAARAFGFGGGHYEAVALMNHLKEDGEVCMSLPGVGTTRLTGRQYLQNYGTEAHRGVFGDDFWIDVVLDKYDDADDSVFVVTDVRFPNEAYAIRESGGEVWLIDRQAVAKGDVHASELLLPAYLIDTVVDNNSDLGHFRDEIGYALVAAHAQ